MTVHLQPFAGAPPLRLAIEARRSAFHRRIAQAAARLAPIALLPPPESEVLPEPLAARPEAVPVLAAALKPQPEPGDRRWRIRTIQEVTEDAFDVAWRDLVGPRRLRPLTEARQTAMWLCHRFVRFEHRARADLSLPEIGRRFRRDHTTVLHACRRVDSVIEARGLDAPSDDPLTWARLLAAARPWPRPADRQ